MAPVTGFITTVEEALKSRLREVINVRNPRREGGQAKVTVRYGFPDEEATQFYPMVVVDLLDIMPNWEETHSAQEFEPTYWPDEIVDLQPSDGDHALTTHEFMPVLFMFQLTSWARYAEHDRQIAQAILLRLAPFRWGTLYVPADDTVRRLELLDYQPQPFIDTNGKRAFRSIYTLQINGEIPYFDYVEVRRAMRVGIDLQVLDQ